MIQKIKSILLDNLLIKLFALMFAVLLWMHAATRGETEITFVVPLEIKDVPAGLMIVGDVPGFVDVRIKGNESLMRGLSSRDIGARISLKGAVSGESLHFLSANNITSPSGLEISRVSPVEVMVRLDKVVTKQVEVRPTVVGKPAKGHTVAEIRMKPVQVTVTGPERFVEKLGMLYTENIDVEGLVQGIEKQVGINSNKPASLRFDPDRVTVRIDITRSEK